MGTLFKMSPSVEPLPDSLGRLKVATAESGAERRMFPRKECNTLVSGMRLDHSLAARQFPRLSLSLRDVSVGGLSATAPAPVAVGERLAVTFPPQDARGGWNVCGRVIRCEPAALGYRIAVAFDAVLAAA